MQVTPLHPIRNIEKRKKSTFIVLSHMRNFSLRHNPMKPDEKGFLPYYVTSKHKNYFYENLEKKRIPFHYHCNLIQKDWEVMVTSPITMRSDMLDQAYKCGYIDSFYRDAIVVAIQDDYAIRVPDLRTFEVLGANIIGPLREELRLPNFRTSIVWFDEIFNIEKYERDMKNNSLWNEYPYEYRPMRYFDRVQFNLEVTRFI